MNAGSKIKKSSHLAGGFFFTFFPMDKKNKICYNYMDKTTPP